MSTRPSLLPRNDVRHSLGVHRDGPGVEDRLGRVRTNLHLVLRELHELSEECSGHDGPARPGLMARVESAAAVFDGEAQAIHDLLYRPEQTPEEPWPLM